ncbi:hypothetical protein INR49_028640 [Caranx melampygus]|nr:hypothetical protein INR49_028640 [Caranx melampygus]
MRSSKKVSSLSFLQTSLCSALRLSSSLSLSCCLLRAWASCSSTALWLSWSKPRACSDSPRSRSATDTATCRQKSTVFKKVSLKKQKTPATTDGLPTAPVVTSVVGLCSEGDPLDGGRGIGLPGLTAAFPSLPAAASLTFASEDVTLSRLITAHSVGADGFCVHSPTGVAEEGVVLSAGDGVCALLEEAMAFSSASEGVDSAASSFPQQQQQEQQEQQEQQQQHYVVCPATAEELFSSSACQLDAFQFASKPSGAFLPGSLHFLRRGLCRLCKNGV